MEELRTFNEGIVLQNKELETRMRIINDEIKNGNEIVLNIGKQLKEIKEGELWKDDYKDLIECASQFNIKKAQAYNLIKAYETHEKYKLEGFTSTQCLQIARLEAKKGDKVVKKALDDNKITSDMSVSKLKDFVDKKLGVSQKALATRNQEAVKQAETEQAETEQAETEQDSVVVSTKECLLKVYYDTTSKEYTVVTKDGTKTIDLKTFKKIEDIILK